MPLVHSTVNFTNRFSEITADVNQLAREAVTAGAHAGAQAAHAVASQRQVTGRMASIRTEPVHGSDNGWTASFVSPVYYAWFQNYGTLGNRRKALKGSPRTNRTRDPGTGVEPLHFLEAGRRAGRKAILARVKQGI